MDQSTIQHFTMAPTEHPVPHRGMITLSIMLATIMQAVDTTIANVAMPHMQGSLQASQEQIAWVLTSYIVAAAVATPMSGWLCGRWGRKQVFLGAVAGFTVASALCGLAENVWQIVAARLLQGVFGAALVPMSQAVLLDINPREKIGQAMAVWGAGIMVGPILGPIIGGWLTENTSWRWVFYINLPVGVLAFLGMARYLPDTPADPVRLDIFGFVTLSLSVGLLQLFLDRGELLDWFNATEIRVEAAGCVIALAFFIAHTWTTDQNAFLNRRLLTDRNFVTSVLFSFALGLILYATMALLPTLLQSLLGYPVADAGELMVSRGVGTLIGMLLVGRLVQRVDFRKLMAAGIVVTAIALYGMTQMTLDMDSRLIVVSGVLQGAGVGFTFVPLSAAAFATLPGDLRNEGTPFFSLMRNVGSSVGISIVQAVLVERMASAHAELSVDIHAGNPVLRSLPPLLDPATPAGLARLNEEVTRQAAMIAYVDDFRYMLVLTLLLLPLLLLRKPGGGRIGA